MSVRLLIYSIAFMFLVILGFHGTARALDKTNFQVKEVELHPETPNPEVCFVMNGSYKFLSREILASSLVLEKKGKKQKIDPRNISVSSQDLCLQKIDYRVPYTVVLPALQKEEGEGWSQSYKASFTMPDRKQALGFISKADPTFLPRYVKEKKKSKSHPFFSEGTAPLLRSINIDAVRITLYRLERSDTFAGAWQKYIQSALIPSESLIYARTQGKQAFESDLIFGGKPNEIQKLSVPLPAQETLQSGLYYLAATPQDIKAHDPGLFAGQWFLISNLRVEAWPVEGGMQLKMSDMDKLMPTVGAKAFLLARDGSFLTEAETSAKGEAFLSFGKDISDRAALLLCQDLEGNLEIIDLAQQKLLEAFLPKARAFVDMDRNVYPPSETAVVRLWAEDIDGHNLKVQGSTLKLLRPDGSVYSENLVPEDNGVITMRVPLPSVPSSEKWRLVWSLFDGQVQAETFFHLAFRVEDSVLEMKVDRQKIGIDGSFVVSLKTKDKKGAFSPFVQGRLLVHAIRFENLAWKEYRFGVPVSQTQPPLRDIPFITGQNGTVDIPIKIEAGEDGRYLQSIQVKASLKDGLEERKTILPILVRRSFIGIKSLPREVFLPGSQHVIFDVVALDEHGKRRSQEGLNYTIIEEGRNFKWKAAEGKWEYELLPHHRRIGGGPLSLSSTGENRISWSVTPGHYILEISDQQENILAQYTFDAGQKSLNVDAEQESISRFFESDQRVFKKSLAPKEIDIVSPKTAEKIGAGKESLSLIQDSLSVSGAPPEFLQEGDLGNVSLIVENNDAPDGVYDYKIKGTENLLLSGVLKGRLKLVKGKSKNISFSFKAQKGLSGKVTLNLLGPNGYKKIFSWPVFVRTRHAFYNSFSSRVIDKDQVSDISSQKKGSVVFISPLSLPDFVPALELFIQSEPQTTVEIARWLKASRLWEKQIVDLGLMQLPELRNLQQQRQDQIRKCQKEDGGFSSVRDVDQSDIESSAAALDVLQVENKEAISLVVSWLSQKMQNTWFDEEERDVRALALASLARAGKMDVSALRYFAQTSEDKELASESAAALSSAFILGAEDEQASRFWALRAHQNNKEGVAASSVDNVLWLISSAQAVLEAGAWSVEIEGEDRKIKGLFSLPSRKKIRLKNLTDRALYLMESRREKSAFRQEEKKESDIKKSINLRRTLYSLNGSVVPDFVPLRVDETYLMWVEVDVVPHLKAPVQVVFPLSSAYEMIQPSSEKMLPFLYPWLPQSLTKTSLHAKTKRSLGFVFEGKGPWRTALLVKPVRRGVYKLPLPFVQTEAGVNFVVSAREMRREIE